MTLLSFLPSVALPIILYNIISLSATAAPSSLSSVVHLCLHSYARLSLLALFHLAQKEEPYIHLWALQASASICRRPFVGLHSFPFVHCPLLLLLRTDVLLFLLVKYLPFDFYYL